MAKVIILDGRQHVFPDDATDADIARALQSFDAEPAPFVPRDTAPREQAASMAQGALGQARQRGGEAASGFAEGLSALIGLPRMIADLSDRAKWAVGGRIVKLLPEGAQKAFEASRRLADQPEANLNPLLPTQEAVRARIPIPRVTPTDIPGRAAHDFGELLGGAPARVMLAPAAIGAAAAGGAREGARALGASPAGAEDAASLAKLVGPLGVAGLQQIRSTPGEMIARRTQSMSPDQWEAAAQAQARAQQAGVPLMGPEAMQQPAMHRLAADTRAMSTGAPAIEDFLRARPGQVAAAAEGQATQLAPRGDPMAIIGRLQAAADDVIERARSSRSAQAGPHYQAAAATIVPQPDVDLIVRQLTDASRDVASDTAKELLGLASRIQANPTVGKISAEFKMLRDRASGAIAATTADYGAKAAAATGGPVIRQGEASLEAISPSYARGQDIMRGPASREVDELVKGPIGRLATRTPDDVPNPTATASRQASIIVDPTVGTPASVRHIARSLGQSKDPLAFRDWAAEYIRSSFNRAAKDVQSGPNLMAGANWRKAIYGEPRSRDNMRAVLEEAAHASGLPPSGVVAGFDRLMDTLQATGRIPSIGSPTATRGATLAEAGEGSVGAAMMNIRLADPLQPLRRWYQDIFQRQQFEELGRIFTDPRSVQVMRQLAMTGPGSARERALMTSFSNIVGLQNPEQEQQGGAAQR